MNQAAPGNVVFVLWEGLRVISGVTTWVGVLRPHLEKRGWQVRVIVADPSQDEAILGKPDGVFRSLQQLKDVLRQFSPGIVVLMNVLRQSACGPVIASLNRQGSQLRPISMVHSDSFDEYYAHVPVMAPWVHTFIAVSPTVAERTQRAVPEGNQVPVAVLPCGVDCPATLSRSYQTSPIRLVYFGRLVETQKRVLDLVPLAGALVRRGTRFTLTIYGGGAEEHLLRERLAEHVRAGRVLFQGQLAHHDILPRLTGHDVFVNLSEFEGTSVAMLEAMARGCIPVVTRASSGVEGVIEHGKNGFHVPVGDMEALAAQIAELASSPGLLERLGLEAHRTVRQAYAMTTYVDRFSDILANVAVSEPICTSEEVERILACLLPVEGEATLRASFLDRRLAAHDAQLASLRITARIERLVAPTLRRLKRTLVRARNG